MNPEELSPFGRSLLNRRGFIKTAGLSTLGIGLASILHSEGLLANDDVKTVSGKTPIRPPSLGSRRYREFAKHSRTATLRQ